MTWDIREGDALARLREMPSRSAQCCVTSPPYFGLRDYGTAEWEGGDQECGHTPEKRGGRFASPVSAKQASNTGSGSASRRDCPCGARRVDRQIGLEATPDEFVARLVGVFGEVRRVLRDDGTLWLNIGDSYAANRTYQVPQTVGAAGHDFGKSNASVVPLGCKPKDLLGIPWLLAFALRADGWYLRSDIIWHKPNPMPESVTDRPTSAHEHVFLLAKSARYFYDAEAIREPDSGQDHARSVLNGQPSLSASVGSPHRGIRTPEGRDGLGRNKRNVWEVATQPYAEAHFATFPPKLVEPCVLAGSSPRACAVCGAPWERVTERTVVPGSRRRRPEIPDVTANSQGRNGRDSETFGEYQAVRTAGWAPTCEHADGSGRCVVLDPFAGSGTTGVVALWHGRDFIGVELSPEYAEMARKRIAVEGPLGRRAARPRTADQDSLF